MVAAIHIDGKLRILAKECDVKSGECDGAAAWTFKSVEAALVECARLWLRSPGDGRWPFAGDGPWHLITGEAGDYDKRGGDGVSSDVPLRALPLTRAEVARRDALSDLLLLAPDRDRRIVAMAAMALAKGAARIPWRKITGQSPKIARPVGSDGLRKRYAQSIYTICRALNAQKCEGRTAQGVE